MASTAEPRPCAAPRRWLWARSFCLACLCILSGCSNTTDNTQTTIRVAVATNFRTTADELARQFTARSGQSVIISSASTGALYAQILNGAPFDLFLAADEDRPRRLDDDGFVVEDGRAAYALGRLALYSRSLNTADGPEVLRSDAYRHCAIANPRIAPYGHAARRALDSLEVTDHVHDRLVKGNSVAQALQMIDSGAAELGLVAWSQVIDQPERSWLVPADRHPALRQEMVLLARTTNEAGARAFFGFLRSPEIQRWIATRGYDIPAASAETKTTAAARPFDWGPVTLTLKLALLSTLILLVIGTPLALWLARTRSRLGQIAGALTAMPLVMPPTVLGFYLLLALGPDSPIGGAWEWATGGTLVFSFAGLVVGSVVYSLPFVVQPIQNAFEANGSRPLEVAATLGAGPWRRFFTVSLPMARSAYLTAATLGFAHALGEFGVVLLIGGNIPGRTKVVSIAIFEHVEALEYDQAHALALGLVAFSFVTLLLVYGARRRHGGAIL